MTNNLETRILENVLNTLIENGGYSHIFPEGIELISKPCKENNFLIKEKVNIQGDFRSISDRTRRFTYVIHTNESRDIDEFTFREM